MPPHEEVLPRPSVSVTYCAIFTLDHNFRQGRPQAWLQMASARRRDPRRGQIDTGAVLGTSLAGELSTRGAGMDEKIYIDEVNGLHRPARATLDVINPATVALTRIAAATRRGRGPRRRSGKARLRWRLEADDGARAGPVPGGIAAHIRNRQPELARLEVEDNGEPLPEADWDIGDAAGCFEHLRRPRRGVDARQGEPITVPDDRFRSSVRYEPIGVAGQIIPWNYRC